MGEKKLLSLEKRRKYQDLITIFKQLGDCLLGDTFTLIAHGPEQEKYVGIRKQHISAQYEDKFF